MSESKPQDQPMEEVDVASTAAEGVEAGSEPSGVSELEARLAEAHDRALRAQAELENVRRRLRREMEEERRYYSLPLVRDLLSVLDNLHRAIEAAEKSEGTEGLLEGVKMVADQLEETLKSHHCIPIDAHGLPFDPNVHEAIGEHPHDELPPGTVALVAQRGFKLHDRVVRPSQVLVSKKKPADDNDSGASAGDESVGNAQS